MAHFITQILLPISLAFIMLGIGLSIKLSDFFRLKHNKTAIAGGFFLQIVALPVLAFLLISLFDIKQEYAVALLLVAACPGGVTSNAITFIFSGAVALSVVLTLLSSIVSPFSIPLIAQWSLGHFISDTARHEFSLMGAVVKLFALSIVPILIGQFARRAVPAWCDRNSDRFRKFSGWWFLLLLLAMTATNHTLLFKVVSDIGWVVIVIAVAAIALGFFGARLMGLSSVYRLTLAIEVGIQNAGMGMIITGTVLHDQTMTMILIAYGILMQIPIFIFAFLYSRHLNQLGSSSLANSAGV